MQRSTKYQFPKSSKEILTVNNQIHQSSKEISSVHRNLPLICETLKKALQEIKQQQSESRQMSYIKRISLNLDFEKIEQMLTDLQKGYIVTKHSPNTVQPHSKFIYISPDRKFLCWKSLDKDDEKMIELKKIQSVIKSQTQFKVESRTVKNFDKIIVIRAEIRTLQVQFRCSEEKDKFYDELRVALKNSKRMNLSYKF